MNQHAHAREPGEIFEIDAAGLSGWLSQPGKLHLYDVRSQSELAQGVIPESKWLPLHLIPMEVERLRSEASSGRLVFYCQVGGRSAQACVFLARLGIGPVYNLRLGMAGWRAVGGAVGPTPFPS